jgi:hypothetical protein
MNHIRVSDGGFDPAFAGQVARWHATPTVRSQTVGEHSWQVARVLLAIWPDAPVTLLTETLFHDVGELGTGDVPSYAKLDEALRTKLEYIEKNARLRMVIPWGVPHPRELPPKELFWLRVAHQIADWEFLLQEVIMGNRLVEGWISSIRSGVERSLEQPPPHCDLQSARAKEYMSRRKEAWL